MKIPRKIFSELAEVILEGGAKQATKYLDEKTTVKATFQGKRRKNQSSSTILFTIGRPNYKERQFIKDCKKAEVKFPVRKLQLKFAK